jgi:hypothetical protein
MIEPDFIPTSSMDAKVTCGEFLTEEDSSKRLESLLIETGLFNVFREVPGEYEYRPHFKESDKKPRIDFLLTPSMKFIGQGWQCGAIGIESKKSNRKIGPPFSQIWDYSTALFRHPTFKVLIKPDFIFLWPCVKIGGNLASLMSQNRFGSVCENGHGGQWNSLDFYCGESKVFRYYFHDGEVDINHKMNFGKRTGSR